MDKTNAGKRVELLHTTDLYTNLKSGDRGTYQFSLRTPWGLQHSIKWDNGSSLMLVDPDRFRFLPEMPELRA